MNRNRQVTRADYARCVGQQVAFLHQQEGTPTRDTLTATESAEIGALLSTFYDNGVSVDAAAADLHGRGW